MKFKDAIDIHELAVLIANESSCNNCPFKHCVTNYIKTTTKNPSDYCSDVDFVERFLEDIDDE